MFAYSLQDFRRCSYKIRKLCYCFVRRLSSNTRDSCCFRLCIALFALSRRALASQAVFGSFYLALKGFNATVMIGSMVNF